MQETLVRVLCWEIPWRREQLPIHVVLPGEFHGQRSLAGYSPWGHKESDKTERLSLHFSIFTVAGNCVSPHNISTPYFYFIALEQTRTYTQFLEQLMAQSRYSENIY